MNEIGAAAEKHMLAIVNYFTSARMLVGRGPPTNVWPLFKNRDVHAGIGQRAARGQPGQSSADYSYAGFLICCHYAMRSRNPRESTFSFSQVVSRTRSVNTS